MFETIVGAVVGFVCGVIFWFISGTESPLPVFVTGVFCTVAIVFSILDYYWFDNPEWKCDMREKAKRFLASRLRRR